jgi:hypothetical protein
MKVISNPMTVDDFMASYDGGAIRVNSDYQRGSGIWSSRAKSALIETIVLGYPMPALFLHQRYDKDSRKPYRDLVDGQQRSGAIASFFKNELRLSKTLPTERLRATHMRDLNEEDYRSFITYSLPVFLFTDATEADVREAFRRINSHTAVLNYEERRHSAYQGAMKWFVLSLSKEVQVFLTKWEVFPKQQLIRMADAKLVSEIVLTMKRGITLIKAKQLDELYESFDSEDSLPDADEIRHKFLNGFRTLSEFDWLVSTPFTKSYQLPLLVLAVIHAKLGVEALTPLAPPRVGLASREIIEQRVGELARVLDRGPADSASEGEEADDEDEDVAVDATAPPADPLAARYANFVNASREKTNTEKARKQRFVAFYRAVASVENSES